MIAEEVKLLDHGYLRVVEAWGSDERIVEAARMSTGKGFLGWGPKCTRCGSDEEEITRGLGQWACTSSGHDMKPGDEKLLRYLYENKHHTPFEMAGLIVEVQAPIFVFREWHRHRVPFSYNEASARYAPLPDLNYVPTVERLMMGGGHLTKQAGSIAGAKTLTQNQAMLWQHQLQIQYDLCERLYREGMEAGVPKELSRLIVPVGRYSKMRASSNVRGWFNFLALRTAPAAQYEIRVYALALAEILRVHFPRTMQLHDEGCR